MMMYDIKCRERKTKGNNESVKKKYAVDEEMG